MEQWRYQLEAPLPGRERVVTDAQAEEEGAAFMAMMDSLGGPSGATG